MHSASIWKHVHISSNLILSCDCSNWFLATSVLESASHPSMLRMDAPSQIKTARSWAVFNSTQVADSISVLDSFLTRRFMLSYKFFLIRIWRSFWENCEIFIKSLEWHHGSSFIALSVNFHGYKRLQHLIHIIFRNNDFSDLVFLIYLMICFLNGHSEYYK